MKECPIVSGAARKIDKYDYNLYCATVCRAEFPAGCIMNCGWPEMAHAKRCAVRHLCPCYNMLGVQYSAEKMEYVCRMKGKAREVVEERGE